MAKGNTIVEKQQRKTILVADDLPDVRSSISGLLEDEGFACIFASTALNAIEIGIIEHPDLVLTDVKLMDSNESNADGFSILSELKRNEATGAIPVIVFTGYATTQVAKDAYALGAAAFVVKSDILQLAEIVQKTLLNAELGIV